MKNLESSNPITQKKKEKQIKTDITVKAIICILLTNILTFMTMSSSTQEKKHIELRSHEKLIKTPIINMTPNSESKVSLYNERSELISADVEIVEVLKDTFETENGPVFYHLIKVQESQVRNFVNYKNSVLHAYPNSNKKVIHKTIGGPREIEI
jgi:hypothetical protein